MSTLTTRRLLHSVVSRSLSRRGAVTRLRNLTTTTSASPHVWAAPGSGMPFVASGHFAFSTSSTPPPADNKDKEVSSSLFSFEDANPERITGIHVHPDSVGFNILPGNLIYKTYKWSGNIRKVPLELAHGYFWMIWDLRNTDSKPTLSNETMIPAAQAQVFPRLEGLKGLSSTSGDKMDFPDLFLPKENAETKDRASNPNACTLVNISFRDSGYKHISSWADPFRMTFFKDPNVHCLQVSITERWALWPLQWALARVMRQNTPPDQHDSTLLYFGNVDDFRDVLRMHNLMTNYVFLVDGLGRVRFAGSGPATDEEVVRVIGMAQELTQDGSRRKNSRHRKGNRSPRGSKALPPSS